MNSYIFLAIAALCIVVGFIIYRRLDKRCQGKIKEVLLYFVIKAEKELGSKQGEAKRKLVYGWLLVKFPLVMRFIPITVFDKLLEEALENMRELLD